MLRRKHENDSVSIAPWTFVLREEILAAYLIWQLAIIGIFEINNIYHQAVDDIANKN